MQYTILVVSALAGLSAAYTPPDTTQPPTGNAITAPLNEIVPAGKPFTIKWTPTDPNDKIALLLLKGPSNNVVPIQTLADGIPNSGSFVWTPDTSLEPTNDAQGYGLEIVVEGTGAYQYSTQIGISKADNAAPAQDSSSSSAVETAPPAGQTQGTAVGGALDETKTVTATSCPESSSAPKATGGAPFPVGSGGSNMTSAIATGTVPLSIPSSLATVALPTTAAPAAPTKASAAGSSGAPNTISTGGAVGTGAQLSGAAAAVAGLLSFFLL